jgi:hypothetical protein
MNTARILSTWIGRRPRRAPGAKPQAATALRGRTLGFEQCEPRIALSTTTASSLSDLSYRSDEGGWINSDALFAVHAGKFVQVQGLIDSDSPSGVASPGIGWSFQGASALNSVLAASIRGDDGRNFAIDSGLSRWNVADSSPLTPLILFDADAFGGWEISVNSWSPNAGQVVRIPPPIAKAGDPEGGHISMAAFSGAAGLSLSHANDVTTLAKGRAVTKATAIEPALAPANPSPVETLRARAVVYEVAQTKAGGAERLDDDESDVAGLSTGETDPTLHLRTSLAAATDARSVEERIDRSAFTPASYVSNDGVAASREGQRLAAHLVFKAELAPVEIAGQGDAGDLIATPTTIESQHGSSTVASDEASAARDAAFALFERQTEAAAEEKAALAATAGSRQRRILGTALVLAVSAGPAYKLWRRNVPLAEQPQRKKPLLASPLPA